MAKMSTGAIVGIGVGVAVLSWLGYQAYTKQKTAKENLLKAEKARLQKEFIQQPEQQQQLQNIDAIISGTLGKMF